MTTGIKTILLAATVLLLTGETVWGQTLAERIEAIRDKHRPQAAKPLPPKIQLLQALAYTKLTVDFDKTPASDVFDYLKTTLGVNVVARYHDDPAGHGIDPETPITLAVEGTAAVDVLELVLEQCSSVEPCTWQLRAGFLEVGTKERLSAPSARELRIYPIAELLFEPPDFDGAPPMGFSRGHPGHVGNNNGVGGVTLNTHGYGGSYRTGGSGVIGTAMRSASGSTNSDAEQRARAMELVELITMIIEPDAWAQNGGTQATITYHSGAIVVRAADFVQRQIGGYPPVPPPAEHAPPSDVDARPPATPVEPSPARP